ncbi:MAG: WbqC family protein [Prevotella sp.]|nr:WbqC family protein [Prevotella sp.]
MATALLSTTYFGPIQWYQKLYRYEQVVIDRQEPFVKQTYRNRCLIATTNGIQALTVPVVHNSQLSMGGNDAQPNSELRTVNCALTKVSDHGNWRHLHWQAIQSAYGESPFFEYYEDDLRPFFTEHNWEYLIDFNDAICQKMCELLDIHPNLVPRTSHLEPRTSHLVPRTSSTDFRSVINPKHPLPDPDFEPLPYYQVYRQKQGFLPNLSILDLLLNMGQESIFYL